MSDFSHYNNDTKAVMVNVSGKAITERTAKAHCFVRMNKETIDAIQSQLLPKGDPLKLQELPG
jgi:cyclic pyranopterin phosphate synthase